MSKLKQRLAAGMLGAMLALALQAHAAVPAGWIIAGDAPTDYEFGTDMTGGREGGRSAYIKLKAANSSGFGTLMQTISAQNYLGTRVRLSGYLRSNEIRRGQLWMRVDGPNRRIASFDNMDSRPVTGTTQWKRYEIVLDVPRDAEDIAFGFFLSGAGVLWADSFRLEIVDNTVPVTGARQNRPTEPANLNFQD
jgi:hypothetical protein